MSGHGDIFDKCNFRRNVAEAFAVTAKLISTFVFTTQIVQSLFFLNPKFPASSHLCLCSSVCVGPVWEPHCWFSHDAAHVIHAGLCGGTIEFLSLEKNSNIIHTVIVSTSFYVTAHMSHTKF